MIFITKESTGKETSWHKIETKVRFSVYSIFHSALDNFSITPNLYHLLLIIEGIQFAWYAVRETFPYITRVTIGNWLSTFSKYFQLDGWFASGTENLFIIAIYISFFVQLIMIILCFILLYMKRKYKNKDLITAQTISRTLATYFQLVTTVISFPIMNSFMTGIICFNGDSTHVGQSCYEGVYFLHMVVSIIGMIIYVVCGVIICVLFCDFNPYSKVPFACPKQRVNLYKFGTKLIVLLYMAIDYESSVSKPFLCIYAFLCIIMLILRYQQTPHFSKKTFVISYTIDGVVFWITFISAIYGLADSREMDLIGVFSYLFSTILFSLAFSYFLHLKELKFRHLHIKAIKKEKNIEYYINYVLRLIRERDNPANRAILEGMFKTHLKNTTRTENDSIFLGIAKDYLDSEEPPELLWYSWLKSIMTDVLNAHPKSSRLHLFYTFVQQEKLENKFKSVFELLMAEESKPSLEDHFWIYRYKSLLERVMKDEEYKAANKNSINVALIVDFQDQLFDFKNEMKNTVELYLEFWRELLEDSPNVSKLHDLGSQLTNLLGDISTKYKVLTDVYPNHIKLLRLYGHFLRNVINDDADGEKLISKSIQIEENNALENHIFDSEKAKYSENANFAIITISGNFYNMGEISNCTSDITRLLGYSKNELIKQNIHCVMPRSLAEIHGDIVKGYIESGTSKVVGNARLVFPLDKQGYLVPCTLLIKGLPNLDQGIRFVGFLQDLSWEANADREDLEGVRLHYIAYSRDSGFIHAFDYNCRKSFGLPSNICYGASESSTDFTFESVFPEITHENFDQMKTKGGLLTTFDSSMIPLNFIVNPTEGDNEIAREELNNRFRRANVRCFLVQDETYLGLNITIIKFVEETDYMAEAGVDDEKKTDEGSKNSPDKLETRVDNEKLALQEGGVGVNLDESNNRSEDGTSSIAESQYGEEAKQLKDFKIVISERTEARSIRILNRSIYFMLLTILILTSLEFGFKFTQIDILKSGVSSIQKSYERINLITDIMYRSRKLEVLGRDLLTHLSAAQQASLNTLLHEQLGEIQNLQNLQFEISQLSQDLSDNDKRRIDTEIFEIEYLLDDGTIKYQDTSFTDSLFEYAVAASAVREADIDELAQTTTNNKERRYFYFMRRNGLGPLREGSMTAGDDYLDFYSEREDVFQTRYLVIMIVSVIILVIFLVILIPITFAVYKTNNKVMSLFGYINFEDIEEMIGRCEIFIDQFLQEVKMERFNDSEEDEEEEEEDEEDLGSQAPANQMENPEDHSQLQEGDEMNLSNMSGRGKNNIEVEVSPEKVDISVRSGEADISHVSDRHFGLKNGQIVNSTNKDKSYMDKSGITEAEVLNTDTGLLKTEQGGADTTSRNLLAASGSKGNNTLKVMDKKKSSMTDDQDSQILTSSDLKSRGSLGNEGFDTNGKRSKKNKKPRSKNKLLSKVQGMSASKRRMVKMQGSNSKGDISGVQEDQEGEISKSRDEDTGPGIGNGAARFTNIVNIVQAKEKAHQLKESNSARLRRRQEEEAQLEFQAERSGKLLQSKDNSKISTVIRFSFVCSLFLIFFIVNYIQEREALESYQSAIVHLQYSAKRTPYAKLVITFTQEHIGEVDPAEVYTYKNQEYLNLRNYYQELLELNDKRISASARESYPGNFDDYFNDFKSYNEENLCTSYTEIADCASIAEGILQKGIRVSITTLLLNTEDVIKVFEDQVGDMTNPTTNSNAQSAALGSSKFISSENILEALEAPLQALVMNMGLAIEDFLDNVLNIDRIKYAVIVIFSFGVLIVLWRPYIRSLNEKIFRTKGMLNMIPLEIIMKSENLKEKFLSGNILHSVK